MMTPLLSCIKIMMSLYATSIAVGPVLRAVNVLEELDGTEKRNRELKNVIWFMKWYLLSSGI